MSRTVPPPTPTGPTVSASPATGPTVSVSAPTGPTVPVSVPTGPAPSGTVGAPPADLRRLLAFRAHGAARLLLICRSRLEDVEGAVAARQTEVAVLMAYELVQLSLSVRGLRTEGEPVYALGEAAFDPFAGVPAEEAEAGMRLAADGLDAVGERGTAWLDRLREHLLDTEALLGYGEPLPDVRSGSGLMKGFRLVRTWQPVLERVGLPDVLPDAWTRRAD
ncbi:hypothetical protein I3J09_27010 [Streptomyces clavuligerus]|uniref:hypothetical protein n=1 Tax=Streptomyces clavuligerus TaxID=1901 RepID=UPI000810837C|nr:hypothetical protein [Streptomyces clavuligerus]ANW21533.1 hypothetical protein BB341_26640 [Streptomyces clavuligerus]AXU16164.1 hypothetical protein D1794_27695 [Streptomyces clavuligerus]QPL66150.1 hypothetical protein I3J04_26995 [Streptomyces clavuligerus]QPL71746.1 hypothetical protein I3J05_24560 [Streptomyces clavuligerus]QPL78262.1 hypothetical protein I3J06_27010 [Streptomyces clavuligerus]